MGRETTTPYSWYLAEVELEAGDWGLDHCPLFPDVGGCLVPHEECGHSRDIFEQVE